MQGIRNSVVCTRKSVRDTPTPYVGCPNIESMDKNRMNIRLKIYMPAGVLALSAVLALGVALPADSAPPTANNQLFKVPPNPCGAKIFMTMAWCGITSRIYGLSFTDPNFTAAPCYENPTFTLLSAPTNGILECRANDNESCQWIPVTVNTPISNDTIRFPYINNAATLNNNKWAYTCTNGMMSVTGSMDRFTWRIANSDGAATATCTVYIVANQMPLAKDIYRCCAPGTDTLIAVGFYDPDMQMKNFSNASAQAWSVKVISPPTNGSFVATNGLLLTYRPRAGVTQGFDRFTYKVNDSVADSANTATGTIQVRHFRDRAGNLVVLVVNTNLLQGVLTNEIFRLKRDLEREGYTSKIKGWNTAASPAPATLWDYLHSEYTNGTQFMAGAILIGDLPLPAVTNYVATGPTTLTTNVFNTDLVYWNMQYFQTLQTDNQQCHIWVSRICWPGTAYGDYGDEITLLRRALDANHDYRTGAARLPHKAFYYSHRRHCDSDIAPAAERLKEVWPDADSRGGPLYTDSSHCDFVTNRTDLTNAYGQTYLGADCLAAGGEIFEEISDGEVSYFMATESYFFISDLYRTINQVRFHLPYSCQIGRPGCLANHMLMTRGGGCVFVAATAGTGTTGENPYEHLISECTLDDRQYRKLIKAGESIGAAAIQYYAIRGVSNDREMFYGDMSLPVMAAPSNSLPEIRNYSVSVSASHSPTRVSGCVDAYDPDGTVSNIEWFMTGYDYGRAAPTFSGSGTNVVWPCATTGVYHTRVEVVDNYKARTWREYAITVTAPTACTVLATASIGGSITPSGNVVLALGATCAFSNAPAPWYHANSVMVDGVNVGTPGAYTFTNALVDHTIAAEFAPDLAANNTPKWWLAQADPDWTNDFNAAATNDMDRDGLFTWQEYITGTDPTNHASAFRLDIEFSSEYPVITLPTIVPGPLYGGLKRYYGLQNTADILAGPWTDIENWTNIQALGQTIVYSNLVDTANIYFCGKTWLAP